MAKKDPPKKDSSTPTPQKEQQWEALRTGKKKEPIKKDSSTPTPQQPMQTKAEQWESLRTGKKKDSPKKDSSTPTPQKEQQWEAARKGNPKQKAAQEEYYNSINFKNKDIDRFSKRFANGESQPWEADAAGFKKTYTPDQINALNKQNP